MSAFDYSKIEFERATVGRGGRKANYEVAIKKVGAKVTINIKLEKIAKSGIGIGSRVFVDCNKKEGVVCIMAGKEGDDGTRVVNKLGNKNANEASYGSIVFTDKRNLFDVNKQLTPLIDVVVKENEILARFQR